MRLTRSDPQTLADALATMKQSVEILEIPIEGVKLAYHNEKFHMIWKDKGELELSPMAEATMRFFLGVDGRNFMEYEQDAGLLSTIIQVPLKNRTGKTIFVRRHLELIQEFDPKGCLSPDKILDNVIAQNIFTGANYSVTPKGITIQYFSGERVTTPFGELRCGVIQEVLTSGAGPQLYPCVYVPGNVVVIGGKEEPEKGEDEYSDSLLRRAHSKSNLMMGRVADLALKKLDKPHIILTRVMKERQVSPRNMVKVLEMLPALSSKTPSALEVCIEVAKMDDSTGKMGILAGQLVNSLVRSRCTNCYAEV